MSTSPAAQLKLLRVMNLSLVAGLTIISVIFYMLVEHMDFAIDLGLEFIFNVAIPLACLSAIIFGRYLFLRHVKSDAEGASLEDRLSTFRTASILRLALAEGAGIFSTVGFILHGQPYYLIGAMAMIALMLSYLPTTDKVAVAMDLSQSERRQLEAPVDTL